MKARNPYRRHGLIEILFLLPLIDLQGQLLHLLLLPPVGLLLSLKVQDQVGISRNGQIPNKESDYQS